MNKKDIEKFRSQLLDLRARTAGRLRRIEADMRMSKKDSAGDLSAYSYHMADAGTDTSTQEIDSNILSVETETLHRIDDALARIDEGTFGLCEMCGGTIEIKRLKALPYAKMCIACQSESEKK